jgi:hypothetical protein
MDSSPDLVVIETFDITGRGVVAVVAETVDFGVGKELRVVITRPDETSFEAQAFQEWLLRRQPAPVEHTGFLLRGVTRSDVPIGSRLEVKLDAL